MGKQNNRNEITAEEEKIIKNVSLSQLYESGQIALYKKILNFLLSERIRMKNNFSSFWKVWVPLTLRIYENKEKWFDTKSRIAKQELFLANKGLEYEDALRNLEIAKKV